MNKITQIKGGTDNCYIVSNGDDAILFDTASGNNLQRVKEECSKYNMKLIVLSHPHFDHAENAEELSKYFNIQNKGIGRGLQKILQFLSSR